MHSSSSRTDKTSINALSKLASSNNYKPLRMIQIKYQKKLSFEVEGKVMWLTSNFNG